MTVTYRCPYCGKTGLGEAGFQNRHAACGALVRIEQSGSAGHVVYPIERGDKPGSVVDEQGNVRRTN